MQKRDKSFNKKHLQIRATIMVDFFYDFLYYITYIISMLYMNYSNSISVCGTKRVSPPPKAGEKRKLVAESTGNAVRG